MIRSICQSKCDELRKTIGVKKSTLSEKHSRFIEFYHFFFFLNLYLIMIATKFINKTSVSNTSAVP